MSGDDGVGVVGLKRTGLSLMGFASVRVPLALTESHNPRERVG